MFRSVDRGTASSRAADSITIRAVSASCARMICHKQSSTDWKTRGSGSPVRWTTTSEGSGPISRRRGAIQWRCALGGTHNPCISAALRHPILQPVRIALVARGSAVVEANQPRVSDRSRPVANVCRNPQSVSPASASSEREKIPSMDPRLVANASQTSDERQTDNELARTDNTSAAADRHPGPSDRPSEPALTRGAREDTVEIAGLCQIWQCSAESAGFRRAAAVG